MEWSLIPGRRNEVLDARVYARAAAAVVGLDRFTEVDWLALERVVGAVPATTPTTPQDREREIPPRPQPPAQRQPWLGRNRGWLQR